MKRPGSKLSLVLMGSLTLGLAGCSETIEDEYQVFTSVNDCVQNGGFTQQQCSEMMAEAAAQTPTFTSLAECEQTFGEGNCSQSQQTSLTGQNQTHGSSWMPLMAGYMMGRFMSGGSQMQATQPLYPAPQPAGQPAAAPGAASSARPSSGTVQSFRTAGGATVTPGAGGKVVNPGASIRQGFAHTQKPAMARVGSGSRGGFSGGSKFGSASS